jgi:hypothetical protein
MDSGMWFVGPFVMVVTCVERQGKRGASEINSALKSPWLLDEETNIPNFILYNMYNV